MSCVLRGIKRAISRKLVKISDCPVSSFLKTVPGPAAGYLDLAIFFSFLVELLITSFLLYLIECSKKAGLQNTWSLHLHLSLFNE